MRAAHLHLLQDTQKRLTKQLEELEQEASTATPLEPETKQLHDIHVDTYHVTRNGSIVTFQNGHMTAPNQAEGHALQQVRDWFTERSSRVAVYK